MAADGSIKIDSAIDGSGFKSGLKKLGGIATKGIVASTAAIGAGVIALGKQAVSAYADYEQLVGGVETLFKSSAPTVEKYASNAFQTAGLTANKYMEIATSFSASLLQSLGGNTEAAAKVTDMAITDMSDNANKMGTNIKSIQDAYQGFAKQNYTMLDNLKLGYGGTKTEMERLLSDAEKISGTQYDISNLNDVYQAIHVIQGELDITGTTAKEASTTIQGSAASMKSAWGNLLVGLADDTQNFDGLLQNLINSVGIFAENLIPHLKTALDGITELVAKLVPKIAETLPQLTSKLLPKIIEIGVSLIQSLLNGFQQNSNQLAAAAVNIVTSLITGIVNMLPQILTTGMQLIAGIVSGIGAALPNLLGTITMVIMQLIATLYNNMPQILQAGINLLMGLVKAIPIVIQALLAALPNLIQTLINYLITAIPLLFDGAIQLLMAIVDAIPTIIDALVTALPQIIETVINGLIEAIPLLLDGAIEFLMAIIDAIPTIIEALVTNLPKIISTITNTLINNLPLLIKASVKLFMGLIKAIPIIIIELVKSLPQIITAIVKGLSAGTKAIFDVGKNLIVGLWNGIKSVKDWIMSKVKGFMDGIVGGIKDFFGIHSPSKLFADEIGKMLPPGISIGFSKAMPGTIHSMTSDMQGMISQMQAGINSTQADISYGAMPALAFAGSGTASNVTNLYQTINTHDSLSESELTREAQNFLTRSKWGLP